MSSKSTLDKVTFKDWLLGLVGLLFVLAGLLMLRTDVKLGVTTLAFFGSCFAVFVRTILRKWRYQKLSALTATVTGGEPIWPSRGRIAMLGLGLLSLGIVLILFRINDSLLLLACVSIMAIAGAVLLVGLATGFLPRDYIQFDPPGITFGGRRGKAIVPWAAISKVVRGEIHGNQAIFIWVDHAAVCVEPSSEATRVHTQMASSNAWTGADFVIMSSNYGIDAPVLAAAIERYMNVPEAREELQTSAKRLG